MVSAFVSAAALSLAFTLRAPPACAPLRARPLRLSAADAAKESLLAALPTSAALKPDSTQAMELSESVLALSAANPTEAPARSRLLNGVWQIAWSQTPGSGFTDSPTRPFALSLYSTGFNPAVFSDALSRLPAGVAELGKVTVTIQSAEAGQPRVTTETSITGLGGTQRLSARANLSPRTDVCLREEFVEAEAFGQKSLLPGPLALSRSLFVVYLDDELLIVRDEGSLVSVLKRVDAFPSAAGEPSFEADDSAPGAG